jgi:type I restriction enzyme R subunit
VINPDELKAVTPDARAKTHFLIVDCVGVTEQKLSDTRPLEKNPTVSLRALLDHAAANGTNDGYLPSLASRISHIDKQRDPDDRKNHVPEERHEEVMHLLDAMAFFREHDERRYALAEGELRRLLGPEFAAPTIVDASHPMELTIPRASEIERHPPAPSRMVESRWKLERE